MHQDRMTPTRAGSLLAIMSLALLATASPAGEPAPAIPANPLGKPYLAPADVPDSLLLVPPPPAPGSLAQARDEEASKAGLALHGGPRWQVATADADLLSPRATGALSCAAGFEISATATPAIDHLLRRLLPDLGLASRPSKMQYNRPRPFMVNGQPSCTPEAESYLRHDGSYPSGHSTIGYGWGMVLAEIVPDRAAKLVARGRAFGDSRRVCNVHWLSDTEEGRLIAPAVIARLHSDPAFVADLAAARAEVAAARKTAPSRDCAAEAAALAL